MGESWAHSYSSTRFCVAVGTAAPPCRQCWWGWQHRVHSSSGTAICPDKFWDPSMQHSLSLDLWPPGGSVSHPASFQYRRPRSAQLHGSQRTPLMKCAGLGCSALVVFCRCSTSAKDMPPFNESESFTLLLKLCTFKKKILLWGRQIFHKIKGRETADHQFKQR
jgi:hypothetical protein